MESVVVTGGNRGLGLECVREILSETQRRVVIACRDVESGRRSVERSLEKYGKNRIFVRELNLGAFASIRRFVDGLLSDGSIGAIGALVCNAGVQHVAPGIARTADGLEETFGVNFLGHFLLERLLLPHLARPARIVWVGSGTHDPEQKTGLPAPHYSSAMDLAFPGEEDGDAMQIGLRRYTTSKLCVVYGVHELALLLEEAGIGDIAVNAMDPGMMPGTGLAREYPAPMRLAWSYLLPAMRLFVPNVNSTATSGRHLAQLATGPEFAGISGKYFEGVREIGSSALSYDRDNARDLWETACSLAGVSADHILASDH